MHLVESGLGGMTVGLQTVKAEIEEVVSRETRAWDTADAELLLTVFHPDMVWPWPKTTKSHDPMDLVLTQGRFNHDRWKRKWQNLFDTHILIHNKRIIRKIVVSKERDGAFAVVDIDTLWRDSRGKELRWKGCVCKVYSRVGKEWKMTMHIGVLEY